MNSLLRHFALVNAFALVTSLPTWGQQAAVLTGTVTDPTGAVVVGAEVILTHEGTEVRRTTTTERDGKYLFTQLAPGTYRIEVRVQGFKTALREHLPLPVGTVSGFDVGLELGTRAEEVVVEAGTNAINRTDASIGNPFSWLQITQLPLESRNAAGLWSLQAGVVFIPGALAGDARRRGRGGSPVDSRAGSVLGSRSDQSNVTLDGVDVNDPQFNFAFTSALRMTLDSLQEFRVTTTNYNADLGRSSAAQISLVSKSGTNEFHGSAYWYHRNEATAANEWFFNARDVEKGKLRKHIFGASLGGPLVKDRLFLFGNWEDLRRSTEESALRSIPSWAYRHGYLIYQCEDGTDPRCGGGTVTIAGQPVAVPPGHYMLDPYDMTLLDPRPWSADEPWCDPVNTGNGCGVNQFALAYFQQFPMPNDPGTGDGLNVVGYRFAAPIKDRFHTYVLRADFNLTRTGSHTVFWRGNMQDDREETAPQFPGQPPSQTILTNNKGFALGYSAIINPSLVNSFRYGLTRIKEETAGLQDRDFFEFHLISGLEEYASKSLGRTIPTHHFRNDVSWTRGRHTLALGTDVRFTRTDRYDNSESFHRLSSAPVSVIGGGRRITPGAFLCASPWGGCTALPAVSPAFGSIYAAAENLLAMFINVESNYNYDHTGAVLPHGEPVARRFGTDEYEVYFQDSWRATPALTITYGARYGLYSPPWETRGEQVSPTISLGELFETRKRGMRQGIPENANPRLGFDLAGPANGRRGYYDWDYSNLSPRVAVAWAPRFSEGFLGKLFGEGKLAIRGGYSIVYDRIGQGLASSFDQVGSFGMSASLPMPYGAVSEETAPRFQGIFDIPPGLLQPAPPGGYPQEPPANRYVIGWGLDDTIVTPYSHTMNVTIAREFAGDFIFQVGYVGRRGRHLLVQRDLYMPLDLCDPISSTCYFEAAQQLVRLANQGQDITALDPIAYWENTFPDFGATGTNRGYLPCDVFGVDPGWAGGWSATQVAYDFWTCLAPDYASALFYVDVFGWPAYALTGPYSFFNEVYAALGAWSSIGRSEYHAMILTARKRLSHGVQFDFNYTLSKSRDHGSIAEHVGHWGGSPLWRGSGVLVNSWQPELAYSYSDFDMRHQVNANWYVELPLGRGKALGSNIPRWADRILDGWQVSGIFRWTSGLPANAINSLNWPTNWNVPGTATCIAQQECPETRTTMLPDGPNLYPDPEAAYQQFRWSMPGETGERNILRGDGYFVIDLGLGRRFHLPWEGHSLHFRWEIFNLTNTPSFDTNELSNSLGSPGTFGLYTEVLGERDGGQRVMQFAVRYEF